jgi:hypothetical protein
VLGKEFVGTVYLANGLGDGDEAQKAAVAVDSVDARQRDGIVADE